MKPKSVKIPNNYIGKSDSEIWDLWTESQRLHFLNDHNNQLPSVYRVRKDSIVLMSKITYDKLGLLPIAWLKTHVNLGQYKNGGKVDQSEYGFGGRIKSLFKKKPATEKKPSEKDTKKYRLTYVVGRGQGWNEKVVFFADKDKADTAFEEAEKTNSYTSLDSMTNDGWRTQRMQKEEFARGGNVSKGELVWNKLSSSDKMNFLIKNFKTQITDRSKEDVVNKAYNFLPKIVKIKLESEYANVEEYAKGSNVEGNKYTFRNGVKVDPEIKVGSFIEIGGYKCIVTKVNKEENEVHYRGCGLRRGLKGKH